MANCADCGDDHHRLHHDKERGWICPECSERTSLVKPPMFGKLRAITPQEKNAFDSKVRNTKF